VLDRVVKMLDFSLEKKLSLLIGLFSLILSFQSSAYSYSAMGNEPVIEGREAMLIAIGDKNFSEVRVALTTFQDELKYFEKNHDDLLEKFQIAIEQKNGSQIENLLDRTIYAVIERRLTKAYEELSSYQVAKVLVMKSKLYLDILSPQLSELDKKNALEAMSAILKSIGNPGVFGVGQTLADPEIFKKNKTVLFAALKQFNL